ncbi:MAG: hydrogenase expression/formation protein HypE [Sedimentisphaerales bacterium]|nr:hydrogenase expression/formation protein HypE [Sedimentisphaerales bacterium]
MNQRANDKVLLALGGGGQLSDQFIHRYILPRFSNNTLTELADAAKLNLDSKSVCFTTDSYVVKPLFFNGGDIGKLAVCGTINDLAVSGARPVAMALSLIIEEGFAFETLEKILDSIAGTAAQNNVPIVTGDTKTVEAGAADGIFINTAGIGVRLEGVEVGFDKIAVGDKVIINGTIGDHGMTIMSQRQDIGFHSQLKSDCAAIADLTCKLLTETKGVHPVGKKFPKNAHIHRPAVSNGVKFMRDPTRGGLAATMNEIARQTELSIRLNEADIPMNPTVQAAADALGLDVLNIANEGKFVAIVAPDIADACINICHRHPLGKQAAIIGVVCETEDVPLVEMTTRIGGRRIVQMPYGRELPRIC